MILSLPVLLGGTCPHPSAPGRQVWGGVSVLRDSRSRRCLLEIGSEGGGEGQTGAAISCLFDHTVHLAGSSLCPRAGPPCPAARGLTVSLPFLLTFPEPWQLGGALCPGHSQTPLKGQLRPVPWELASCWPRGIVLRGTGGVRLEPAQSPLGQARKREAVAISAQLACPPSLCGGVAELCGPRPSSPAGLDGGLGRTGGSQGPGYLGAPGRATVGLGTRGQRRGRSDTCGVKDARQHQQGQLSHRWAGRNSRRHGPASAPRGPSPGVSSLLSLVTEVHTGVFSLSGPHTRATSAPPQRRGQMAPGCGGPTVPGCVTLGAYPSAPRQRGCGDSGVTEGMSGFDSPSSAAQGLYGVSVLPGKLSVPSLISDLLAQLEVSGASGSPRSQGCSRVVSPQSQELPASLPTSRNRGGPPPGSRVQRSHASCLLGLGPDGVGCLSRPSGARAHTSFLPAPHPLPIPQSSVPSEGGQRHLLRLWLPLSSLVFSLSQLGVGQMRPSCQGCVRAHPGGVHGLPALLRPI